jgi:hypothetical protein
VNQLVPMSSSVIPALIGATGERAGMRFLEFFAANIRNPHTRRAYARAAEEFLGLVRERRRAVDRGCAAGARRHPDRGGTREFAAPSVKQRLAAIRHLFDWLVTGQVVPVNPAGSVRGPRHVVTSGQTPVLDPAEARAARQHRHVDRRRPALPCSDRAHGLFLRADRCGARHDGEGRQAAPVRRPARCCRRQSLMR